MKPLALAPTMLSGCLLSLSSIYTARAENVVPPVAAPLSLEESVRDRNFYLYRVLLSAPTATIVRMDPTLAQSAAAYRERLSTALSSCALNALCYISAARLTDQEIKAVSLQLSILYDRERSIHDAVDELRKSGTMIQFQSSDDRALLERAWFLSASSINRIFDIYGEGVAPPYGDIDEMSQDPHSQAFGALVRTAVRDVLDEAQEKRSFFACPAQLATLVLAINGREDAGRFEPLDRGENAAAVEQISHTDWAQYRYAAILVPGDGPDQPEVKLSARGRLRLERAVMRYRSGAAPLIVVSGGSVHPAHTSIVEAIEMKRALMGSYQIPEAAILVEPHARHTTTNFRNTARLLYRYRAPFTMTSLVVTDETQADAIMDSAFDDRNIRELGSLPYATKKRISPLEIEFTPSITSLQVNWADPLDP